MRNEKPKIVKGDFDHYFSDGDISASLNDQIEFVDDPLFETGQVYEDHAVFKIKCSVCGSDSFNVGHHSCLTVVKCVGCKKESIIHDG